VSRDSSDQWRPDHVRASDANRAKVAEKLHGALDEGRISLTEYDDRLSAAYGARTYGDLATLTGDLPGADTALPGASPQLWEAAPGLPGAELTKSSLLRHGLPWLCGAVIVSIVAAARGGNGLPGLGGAGLTPAGPPWSATPALLTPTSGSLA
jgi:hypothetical protein